MAAAAAVVRASPCPVVWTRTREVPDFMELKLDAPSGESGWYCNLCWAWCDSFGGAHVPYAQDKHFQSKTHRRKMEWRSGLDLNGVQFVGIVLFFMVAELCRKRFKTIVSQHATRHLSRAEV